MMISIRQQQREKVQIFRNEAMVRKQNGLLEKPSIGKYLVPYYITANDIKRYHISIQETYLSHMIYEIGIVHRY